MDVDDAGQIEAGNKLGAEVAAVHALGNAAAEVSPDALGDKTQALFELSLPGMRIKQLELRGNGGKDFAEPFSYLLRNQQHGIDGVGVAIDTGHDVAEFFQFVFQ